ncbi:MAG: IS1 family transposase [Bacteroidetes bacterium]|nr:IS1 family transposase [Bacteroidota bacterium]
MCQLCLKAGRRKNGTQKFRCQGCKKYQQQTYKYQACYKTTNQSITQLLIEGLGIRSIARVLKISITTVIRRIKGIARLVNKPFAVIRRGIYEIDELWTFIGKKSNETWIAYSLERQGRKVIDFKVGARSIENLKRPDRKRFDRGPEEDLYGWIGPIKQTSLQKALNIWRVFLKACRFIAL